MNDRVILVLLRALVALAFVYAFACMGLNL